MKIITPKLLVAQWHNVVPLMVRNGVQHDGPHTTARAKAAEAGRQRRATWTAARADRRHKRTDADGRVDRRRPAVRLDDSQRS